MFLLSGYIVLARKLNADPIDHFGRVCFLRDSNRLAAKPVEWRKLQLAELPTPAPSSVLYVGHFNAKEGAGCSSTRKS